MSHVLLVDHQGDVCKSLASALLRMGHVATYVSSGAAAIDLLSKRRVDLVVVDLMMPGMDGWQVLKWVQAAGHTDLPVIVHGSEADSPCSLYRTIWARQGTCRRIAALMIFVQSQKSI